ncbi:MAG: hypothetical protein HY445_00010 [Candidatus Niyogibacteria bacterium]|nr:hypothetical protein [Candidatus Niyogibacteria bacterium]
MAKLDFIDWPSTILLAAPSLKLFEDVRTKYANKYPHIAFGWWPTIPSSYWVSGLANTSDLERLFAELTSKVHEKKLSVLIDLEFPIKKHLYIKNIFRIRANKKRILEFFTDAPRFNLRAYTAEYPAPNALIYTLYQLLGISPSFKFQHTKLPMCYSSIGLRYFGEKIWNSVKSFEKKFAQANSDRVGFGLGATAIGMSGNGQIITPKQLAEDIDWANGCGVKEIFIFRLGGLNESYVSVLKEFAAP